MAGTVDLPDDDVARRGRQLRPVDVRSIAVAADARAGAAAEADRPAWLTIDAAVADTHALLYHASGSRRLGKRAAAHFARAESREALVYVPAAVIWEVTLLARAGRFNLRRAPREFFGDLFSNPAYQAVRSVARRRSSTPTSSASTAIRSTP